MVKQGGEQTVIDPNTAMEAAKEGAKAANKFQEILLKIFGPKWKREQADANAYADERKLQIIRGNPDMEIVYIGDEMHARERTPEALAERAQQRQLFEAMRQEDNLESVLEIAAKEVLSIDMVSDDPVDDDWITRLFNIVKDVNSKEMQYLWGKILAGQIATPGSFSLRTLEIVRNMSRTDAEIFQRVLPFIIRYNKTYFISSDTELNKHYGLRYSDILALDECGLMNSSGMVSLHLNISDNMQVQYYTNERVMITKNRDNGQKKISFGVFSLSNVGIELYNILQHSINTDYFIDFTKEVRNANKKVIIDISVHQVNSIGEKMINFEDDPLCSFPWEG